MYYKNNFKRNRRKQEKPLGGMTVTVRNNDVAGAMRVLKKKLMNEGLFQELRERSYHQTKGEKRRKAKAAGKRRWERKLAKRKQELG